jgi:TRAP-type C4-dicarboxylate transport system permease small subunit
MFKLKDIIIGIIISALAPILIIAFFKYNSSTEVVNSDGSVTMTAQWIGGFTFTSYLFTVGCIFILYMTIRAIIKVLRKKRR